MEPTDHPALDGDAAPAEPGRTIDFAPASAVATQDGAAEETALPAPAPGRPPDVSYTDPDVTVAPEAGLPVGLKTPESVAGYEVLGVLGRGAMGVVYKARQRGLNRIVALKMILSGAHAGECELGRFRTEAEAVARIQHPNIVQIHEVGEENGQAYFSLEYVDGGSLAGKLNHVPQPPKEAARLVHLLAGAMDAAHKAGVVHRDLKPANVLMTRDGAPKVTDFGLAKRLEHDSGRTYSGSVIGSPGYMAPEQAEGRNEAVGPLADVYALGVVLYEMLTGRIPFRAPTVLETLEQIRTREPVAPAQLQPGVPRDLDTICLKCLQKDPRKRYETATALAEDLRRFLNDEPILARPVGRIERAWRWSRRNPRLALMGATTAAVVVGWAVSMSALAWRLKLQKDESDRNYTLAMTEKQAADANADDAKAKKAEADRNAETARINEKRANDGADVAVRRMTELAGQVQQKLNGRFFAPDAGPELRALRDDVLGQLRAGMTGMAHDLDKVGATSFGQMAMYQQVGDRLKRLGQGEEALKQYNLGADLGEKIAGEQPDNDRARANWAVMLIRLGDMELELNGDAVAARDYYEKALARRHEVADQPHGKDYTDLDNQIGLSHLEMRVGQAELALGDAAAARGHFDKAAAGRKAWSDAQPKLDEGRSYLAEAQLWRGTACARLGEADEAGKAFAEGVALCRELVQKHADAYWYKADLADALGRRGDAELRQGRDADAEKSYRESLESLRPALEHAPDQTDYQAQSARAEERLGAVAERKGDRDAARDAYQKALKIREELLAIEPNNRTWQAARAVALGHCGRAGDAAQKADEIRRQSPKSVPLLLDAARCYAACAGAADAAAKRGFADKAVAALGAAAANGYRDGATLKSDPDLVPLAGERAYQTLLDELAKR